MSKLTEYMKNLLGKKKIVLVAGDGGRGGTVPGANGGSGGPITLEMDKECIEYLMKNASRIDISIYLGKKGKPRGKDGEVKVRW